MLFQNIGLAITFSPTGKALFMQAERLAKLFEAKLTLIHIGKDDIQADKLIDDLVASSILKSENISIVKKDGDPAETIIKTCESEKIDLLVAGALEREKFIKYYVGSVARKLMRRAPCSVLIFVNPSSQSKPFSNICVSINFSEEDEFVAKTANQLAELEKTDHLTFIREFEVPGLSFTVTDNGSVTEVDELKSQWQKEETEKLNIFINELNLKSVPIKAVSLYGKQGWQISKYAESVNSDLLVLSTPKKKLKFVDRLFQHDLEFILHDLPCNVLILQKRN